MSVSNVRRGFIGFCRLLWRVYEEMRAEGESLGRSTDASQAPLDAGPNTDLAVLSFSDLVMNTRTREVRRGARSIELTRTEFKLLELMLRNPRQVLTREVIFDRVWGFDFGPSSNALSVYVGYLRRKTETAGESRLIQTIRGVGYMLRE